MIREPAVWGRPKEWVLEGGVIQLVQCSRIEPEVTFGLSDGEAWEATGHSVRTDGEKKSGWEPAGWQGIEGGADRRLWSYCQVNHVSDFLPSAWGDGPVSRAPP